METALHGSFCVTPSIPMGMVSFITGPLSRCTSPNTVQLATLDTGGCVEAGLGPGGVDGAFDVPLGVLPLHDARCCASATLGVESSQEPTHEVEPAGTVSPVLTGLVRGEKRPGGRGSGG